MFSVLFRKYRAALIASCAVFNIHAQALPGGGDQPEVVPGEIIVQFKAGASDAEIQRGLTAAALNLKRHIQTAAMADGGNPGLTLATTALPVDRAIEALKNNPGVEYAEPNYVYRHQYVSNDPYVTPAYGYLWGLYGDLSTPANIYGSQAAEAWGSGYVGDNNVYVGVLDEGIQTTHPDLSANIWTNPFDPVDGVDNDGNGYIDDSNGWNFFGNNRVVFDSTGDSHGTHVAGTIGAKGGNGVGLAGVNWNVTILSGKFLGPNGGSTLDAAEAVDYFVDLKKRHGLNIVAMNASFGGGGYSQTLHSALIRAAKAGILFIAAAGNSTSNNDVTASYPSNMDTRVATSTETAASYDSVIAVAAIDSAGALAGFSSYGATKVDLGAPGVSIASTYPGGYAYMSGTSMATPHVTGAVALYASTHPGATGQSIRTALLGSVTATASLTGKVATGGRLNLSTVIAPTVVTPPVPASPASLAASAGNGYVQLNWPTVSGATSYVVKRSGVAAGPFTVVATGVTLVSWTDYNVVNGATYYYVVAAVNSTGSSANSPVASATPLAPPAVPTNLTATGGNAIVTLGWTPSSGATSYRVGRSTVASGPFSTIATGITLTGYTDPNVVNGTTYYYVVAGVNAAGTSANSGAAFATPSAPVVVVTPPPSAVSAVASLSTVAGTGTVTVTWSGSAGALSYNVKSASTSAGPWSVIASGITTTSFGHTVAANGTARYYVVSANSVSGETANSASATVVPLAPTPANLTANKTGSSMITLRWTDRTSDEQGFSIESWNGSAWSWYANVGAGSVQATVSGNVGKRSKGLRVRAYNGTLNTAYSNTAVP